MSAPLSALQRIERAGVRATPVDVPKYSHEELVFREDDCVRSGGVVRALAAERP